MHRLDVALVGGGLIPGPGAAEILGDALAALVEHREAILGRRETGGGGALEPAHGIGQVLRRALALGVAKGNRILRARIALGRGLAQFQRAEIGRGHRQAHRHHVGARGLAPGRRWSGPRRKTPRRTEALGVHLRQRRGLRLDRLRLQPAGVAIWRHR